MSSAFETALKDTMNGEMSVTENGAIGFKTSGKKLLDLNFAVSSLRNKPDDEIVKMFSEAFYESPLLSVKWLFMLRDPRGGIGERRSFRVCFKWLAEFRPEIAVRLISLVKEYGRFDDLFCLIDIGIDSVQAEVIRIIDEQLTLDMKNMKEGKPVSLLAKWMPSVNTSSSKTVMLARQLAKALDLTEKQYRKTLSALRKHIDVIERKMSAKRWAEIDYEKVPSQANIKYKSAFLRNDEARRREYLAALQDGKAKINSTTCFPSDIVHAYAEKGIKYRWGNCCRDMSAAKADPTLEAMWKALPDVAVNGNVLAVADGSSSMETCVGSGSSLTALEVANALAIYCAEHCTGPFHDKYITFSRTPQYVDMSNANTLAEKLGIAYSHNECANTNIEATFDLILQTAIGHNLKQEDIPTLVILSDMEIDRGVDIRGNDNAFQSGRFSARKTALMEQIRLKWESHGYTLPRTIWWNIASRTGTIPLTQDAKSGIVLCSGYSQSQFKMIASNKLDPFEVLIEALNVERYASVEAAIKDVL